MLSKIGCLIDNIDDSIVSDMVLPHKLFSRIANNFPQEFRTHLGGDPVALRRFWFGILSSDEGRRLVSQHQHLRNRSLDELQCVIPLVVHCDGAPITKKTSAMVLQWGSVIGQGFSTSNGNAFVRGAGSGCREQNAI